MEIFNLLSNASNPEDYYSILNKRIIKIRSSFESIDDEDTSPHAHELSVCKKMRDKLSTQMEELITRKYKKVLNMAYENDQLKNPIIKSIKSLENKQIEITENRKKNMWFWLSINPDWSKTDLETFKSKIVKCMKKKSIKEFYITIEQRHDIGAEKYKRDRRNRKKNNEAMLKSIHAHLLIKRDVFYKKRDKCKFPSDIKKTFKTVLTSSYRQQKKIDGYSEPNFYYYWLEPQMVQDKMNYITGKKQQDKKNIKAELDPIMRKLIEVPDFITLENISLL